MLQPGRGVARGLPSWLIENAGPWPPAEHGGPGAFSLGEAKVDVGSEEPRVAVFFHQAVDFALRRIEAGIRRRSHGLLDGHLGGIVDVDLKNKSHYYQYVEWMWLNNP